MTTYKIIRFYFGGNNEVRKRGLTLEEAQAHCKDKETSSGTCSEKTRESCRGLWFDGYERE